MKKINKEVWKDIKEYEGLYQVSSLGRVKSLNYNKTKKEKILKPHESRGYYNVTLYKNGFHKYYGIHRLVAKEFIVNPKNKTQVNHKDGNKKNNNIENLEWVTSSENMKHAFENNLHKKYYGKEHNNARKIKQYTLNNIFIKEWGSIVEAANYYKTSIENIYSCLNKKSKTAKGFKWEYSQMR